MAEKEAKAEDAKAPTKNKPKLLLIAGAGVALAAVGGGAAAYLLIGKKDAAHAAEQKAQPRKTPVFVDLESFTVNLRDDDDRFMQVKLVAEMRDAAAGDVLKNMMPAVRSEILLLLGSKTAADLATREGKEKLAREIVAAANKPLERTPAENAVEAVNFTHLIIQ